MTDMNSPIEENTNAEDDSENNPNETSGQKGESLDKTKARLRLIGILGGLGLSVFFQAIGQSLLGLAALAVAIGIPFLLSEET